jgi:hypothetical protein
MPNNSVFYYIQVHLTLIHTFLSASALRRNGSRLCVVADFQHKSSIEELHLNIAQNCHTKHCTRHYAKPMLADVALVLTLLVV